MAEVDSVDQPRIIPSISRGIGYGMSMLPPFLDRHIRPHLVEALTDTRVVVLLGARQVGKSTLAQEISRHEHPAAVITLDDRATRIAAQRDPTGFVADLATPVVIDEVQRVPDVLLAI